MLSVGGAARLLGVTPATARRWTEIGLLPCTRTAGGHRRIARADVVELARAIGGSTHMSVRQARERELETLVEASVAVAGQLDQGALLAEIAKYAMIICRCHTCTISSYEPDAQTVTTLAEYDTRGRRTAASGSFDLRRYPETLRRLEEQVSASSTPTTRVSTPRSAISCGATVTRARWKSRSCTRAARSACSRRSIASAREPTRVRSCAWSAPSPARPPWRCATPELFRAAHQADAAMQGVRERLQALAHALVSLPNPATKPCRRAPSHERSAKVSRHDR